MLGKLLMKSAEPVTSCRQIGGRPVMKCSSLDSFHWLRLNHQSVPERLLTDASLLSGTCNVEAITQAHSVAKTRVERGHQPLPPSS
jgi:hypothetical protein